MVIIVPWMLHILGGFGYQSYFKLQNHPRSRPKSKAFGNQTCSIKAQVKSFAPSEHRPVVTEHAPFNPTRAWDYDKCLELELKRKPMRLRSAPMRKFMLVALMTNRKSLAATLIFNRKPLSDCDYC